MKRQGKEHAAPPPATARRGYITWNSEMDAILTSTLYEQINEGNKGDGDFKPQAYQAVVDKLRVHLNIYVTVAHVKNRIKVWKRHYAMITKIRTYTKFKWDEERKMLVIPIEQVEEWKTYCKENSYVSAYQNKCIENWDDICTLFASDRATGDGAEQHEESATAMEMENEVGSGSETTFSAESNKRIKRDRLADAVTRFAESFTEYVSKAQGPPRPSSKEIYDVLSAVHDISRMEVLKGVKSFMNGTPDMFDMLKSLPDNDKLDWILLHIDN